MQYKSLTLYITDAKKNTGKDTEARGRQNARRVSKKIEYLGITIYE